MQRTITIIKRSDNETVFFAAQELRRYIRMMSPESGSPEIISDAASKGIHIGMMQDFGLSCPGDPSLDDTLYIEIKDGKGIIAGSNPRSVLAAVYRYLHENGCRWPRPGLDGELIPVKECADISYRHTASNRRRGLCIEGAVSFQNMLENIDWAPKAGFNTYMLEYIPPRLYFENWYEHKNSAHLESERVCPEELSQRCAWLETEIKMRGMEFHAAGHGWTSIPFGMGGSDQTPRDYGLTENETQYMAMINGKRGIFRDGVAVHTNLCYSNPAAREKMVKSIADYAEKNGHIDYLHVWLADNDNNFCECDGCKDTVVSDFYVDLLNEIDAELTRRGCDMKIAFIAYNELLWPPETRKISNPDRFGMLFAPSMRTYSDPYTDAPYTGEPLIFNLNAQKYTKNVAGNLEFLRGWQKVFAGGSFCYEYYFWRDHCLELGYYDIAKIIHQDVLCLEKLGIGGIISDQTQRSFMPTGFPMYVLGQTLFDTSLSFEELESDFFGTFGEDGEKCRDYMAELSRLFDAAYLRGPEDRNKRAEKPPLEFFVRKDAAEKLGKIRPLIENFRPIIRKNMGHGSRCVAKSWKYLDFHAGLCERMADIYHERATGNMREAAELWRKTQTWISLHENDVQDAFDLYLFVYSIGRFF